MQGASHELHGGRRLNTRKTGDRGEALARGYLARRGYEILESNYRTRYGEIDLVARRKETLVFVEVKLRRNTNFGDPLESVTPRKQEQVRAIAEQYLQEKDPEFGEVRFDVIGVLGRPGSLETPEITHVENAF